MGGNHFKKDYKVESIKREELKYVLDNFKKILNDIYEINEDDYTLLGSTDKKSISGDIDFGLSRDWLVRMCLLKDRSLRVMNYYNEFEKRARTATEQDLLLRAYNQVLVDELKKRNVIVDEKAGIGQVFTLLKKENGNYVQLDILSGDLDLLKFMYYSKNYEGNLKGLHRTQLLISFSKYKGYTLSHIKGLIKDGKRITEPKMICKILGLEYNKCYDFIDLLNEIQNNVSVEDLMEIMNIYFNILSHTRTDIPEVLQPLWKEMYKINNYKTDFLPENSKLQTFLKENK